MFNENDFIQIYKDKLYYYYFDTYTLDSSYYEFTLNYYKQYFRNVLENVNVDRSVYVIIKLKMLANKSPEQAWTFPVVIHQYHFMACGSGRILIDKLIHNKENQKTIMVCNSPLEGLFKRIETLDELKEKLNIPCLRFYTKGGIIANMFSRNHLFDTERERNFIQHKNKVIEQIKQVNINDVQSIINFIKRPCSSVD